MKNMVSTLARSGIGTCRQPATAWNERIRMMHARNLAIKERLQSGNPVQFRVWGLNMYPSVHKCDCCLFEPVGYVSKLRIGDIIFCQLDIGG